MVAEPDESIIDYVKAHRLAILATQNKSGPAQLTMITYLFDGQNFLIVAKGSSLKAKNLKQRPEVSMAIVDGRRQLIVYGVARLIENVDEVVPIATRLRENRPEPGDVEEMRAWVESEQRVIIVIAPSRYYPRTMP